MRANRNAAQHKGAIPWTGPEKWVRRGIIGFVAVLAVLAVWFTYSEESERRVVAAGSDIRIALKDLKPGKLRLVSYAIDSSTTTQVAIQRGEDTSLRVAFGACRNCYRFSHYKWFGKLVCGHCRHAIPLPEPGEKPAAKKGCNSVAIPYVVDGDRIVVSGMMITDEFHKWYQPGKDKN